MFKNYFILAFIFVVSLVGCKKDSIDLVKPADNISLEYDELTLSIDGRYHSFKVYCDKTCMVSCDESWVEISNLEIEANGNVKFYIGDNHESESRSAYIEVCIAENPSELKLLRITQQGLQDLDDNAGSLTSLEATYKVGYGYDITQDFMSTRSATKAIINYDGVLQLEEKLGYPIIQKDNRSSESLKILSGYTLNELSTVFASESEVEGSILFGAANTVSSIMNSNKYDSQDERCYGYGRFSSIVASIYMDSNTITYLVDNDDDTLKSLLFTTEFNNALKSLTANNVDAFIDTWGTHMVVTADLGGALIYQLDFLKSATSNVQQSSETAIKYILGKEVSSESTSNVIGAYTSSFEASSSIVVMGGEATASAALVKEIASLTNSSTISSTLLDNWLQSFVGDYVNLSSKGILSVVNCQTIPIWYLISDAALKEKVKAACYIKCQDAVESTIVSSSNMYEISLTDEMLTFDDSESQVRVLYKGSTPILEICNEYVPDIRTDKRVVVVYPIAQGSPNIMRGIFLGDGESNPPSNISFEGDAAYIAAIDGQSSTSVIRKLYYILGSLYLEDLDANISYSSSTSFSSVYCTLDYGGDQFSIPFVKIGSGYWTRENSQYALGFGQYWDPSYYYTHTDGTKTIYMCHYNPTSGSFAYYNSGVFGSGYWYVPTTSQVETLQNYLYKNPKALLKGQSCGFDAQFSGYYGWYNLSTQSAENTYEVRDYGKYCYIACKDTSDTGSALRFDSNYNMTLIDDTQDNEIFYPIRLYRGESFAYSSK